MYPRSYEYYWAQFGHETIDGDSTSWSSSMFRQVKSAAVTQRSIANLHRHRALIVANLISLRAAQPQRAEDDVGGEVRGSRSASRDGDRAAIEVGQAFKIQAFDMGNCS